jgi:suppressor for copper-sensitivity B
MNWRVAIAAAASLWLQGDFSARAGAEQPSLWPGLHGKEWVKTGPAAVRLISERDGYAPNAAATLGVQIKLRPGWWTYWRSPGDAGMPPDFDWSGSSNLKWAPELFWPKPLQKSAFRHALRVYRDEVIFPLRVVAKDPTKPVNLKLTLTFGVCKDVCIPNRAEATLSLDPVANGIPPVIAEHMALIRKFIAEVPTGNVQRLGFRIRNVGVMQDASGGPILAVELDGAPPDSRPLVLIDVAPDEAPLIAKSLGRAAPGQKWRFAADLESGLEAAALAGKRVRITIFDGGRALEQTWVIGASADSSGRFGGARPGSQIADPMTPGDDTWKPRD